MGVPVRGVEVVEVVEVVDVTNVTTLSTSTTWATSTTSPAFPSETYFDVELTPGEYVAICFIPDSKDGKPHLEHGMVRQFTVS